MQLPAIHPYQCVFRSQQRHAQRQGVRSATGVRQCHPCLYDFAIARPGSQRNTLTSAIIAFGQRLNHSGRTDASHQSLFQSRIEVAWIEIPVRARADTSSERKVLKSSPWARQRDWKMAKNWLRSELGG